MKKARILAFLMTVALTTTSFISGTVAKYTTSDATGDSAQVAKWGVELSVDGTLFGKNYEDYDGGSATSNHPTASTTDSEISVKSESEAKLVAPGTQNDTGITVSLTGKTEVRTKVTMEISYQNVCLPKGNYYMLTKAAPTDTDTLKALFADGVKVGLFSLPDNISNIIHLISAILVFGSFGLMTFTQFTKGKHKYRNILYYICGGVILLTMLLMGLSSFVSFLNFKASTMIYELIMLEAFAIAWLTKSGIFFKK